MSDQAAPSTEDRINALPPLLVDDFARNLFLGAQRVLGDAENPVRLHMFAATVRELFSYTLHLLAPDEEVRSCPWFVMENGLDKPTRRQRVQFAIYGGLKSDYVTETLFLEPENMTASVIDAIDYLNRFTHVRPDTLVNDAAEIAEQGAQTMLALADFVDNMKDARKAVAFALEGHVHDAVFDAISSETLPELDELSSHYSIEEHDVEDVDVVRIGPEWIHLSVRGSVTVGLQWGSNSDIRNDMGAVGEESFPFQTALKAPVHSPQSVETDEEGPAAVDTSSWYDNYYDPEDDFRDPEADGDEDAQ